ncbi:hypothetical protein HanOQP8_Chr08g0267951 [Helianthus annuus]|nr:hypothetical protein HanOQP8_Chr08g0267951 [Helianthus annuus]
MGSASVKVPRQHWARTEYLTHVLFGVDCYWSGVTERERIAYRWKIGGETERVPKRKAVTSLQ